MASGCLQLSVFPEQRAAITADVQAVRGKRRPTAKEVIHGHAGCAIAESFSGGFAGREFSQVDCTRAGSQNTRKRAGDDHDFHDVKGPLGFDGGRLLAGNLHKSYVFVRRTIASIGLTLPLGIDAKLAAQNYRSIFRRNRQVFRRKQRNDGVALVGHDDFLLDARG